MGKKSAYRKQLALYALYCLVVTCQLWSLPVSAEQHTVRAEEEKKEHVVWLDEIVVTATRTEKELDAAPGSVAVVTKEEIAKRNIKTVDEALNTTAGVIYGGKGFTDTMSRITLRGIPGQSRTLVLLDGMTLNSPYAGTLLWSGIAPGSLERIEVVKGPFSSLYGGYAMGGAINLITRMPVKREFTLQSGYGSGLGGADAMDNVRRVSLSYGDRFKDRFSLFLSNAYTATDGYPADFNVQSTQPSPGTTGWSRTTDNTGDKRYLIGVKGSKGWRHDNLTLKTQYDFSRMSKVNFCFMRSQDEWNYDDPHTYLRDAAGNEVWSYGTVKESSFLSGGRGSEQYIYNLGVETEISSVKIKLALGYLVEANSWGVTLDAITATRSGGIGKLSDTPAGAYSADMQGVVPLFERHLLTFGGSFRIGWADSKERTLSNWKDEGTKGALTYQAKGSDRTFALFLQDEIMILDQLTAYVGIRQDWWETFDGYANQVGTAGYPISYGSRNASSFSPKAALVYQPFGLTIVKASVGRAFRAPTVYDLYRTWTSTSGTTYAGNPDLKPETTTSGDIGIEQGLWQGAKVKATYFENYITGMIYNKTVTPTYQSKINAGKAESRGVELEAEQKLDAWLRLFANFTYTDATIKENDAGPASVGKRLTDMPEKMFNIGADFEHGPFGALLIGRYVGKRYGLDNNSDTAKNVQGAYDPYFTADVKLRYKLTSWATASFSIDNIFNEQYFVSSKAPGRSWFGELTLRY